MLKVKRSIDHKEYDCYLQLEGEQIITEMPKVDGAKPLCALQNAAGVFFIVEDAKSLAHRVREQISLARRRGK